jgi:hypothetical protein
LTATSESCALEGEGDAGDGSALPLSSDWLGALLPAAASDPAFASVSGDGVLVGSIIINSMGLSSCSGGLFSNRLVLRRSTREWNSTEPKKLNPRKRFSASTSFFRCCVEKLERAID